MIHISFVLAIFAFATSFAEAANLDSCQQLAQNTFREQMLKSGVGLGRDMLFEGATKPMSKCSSKKGITFHFDCVDKGKSYKAVSRDMCCDKDNKHLIDYTPEEFGLPTGKPRPGKPRPPENELYKPQKYYEQPGDA